MPGYALRTTLRMLASLIFTFTYATAAGKSRRTEMVLIPLLDVLQSVPVLGLHRRLLRLAISRHCTRAGAGRDLRDLHGPSLERSFQLLPSSADHPHRPGRGQPRFSLVGLAPLLADRGAIRDAWTHLEHDDVDVRWLVFCCGSEAIAVGSIQVALPGFGSYVALAIQQRDLAAVGWAIVAMRLTILIYDQLLFRPLVVPGTPASSRRR
jgi:NitT/TauT family transport system permease protein